MTTKASRRILITHQVTERMQNTKWSWKWKNIVPWRKQFQWKRPCECQFSFSFYKWHDDINSWVKAAAITISNIQFNIKRRLTINDRWNKNHQIIFVDVRMIRNSLSGNCMLHKIAEDGSSIPWRCSRILHGDAQKLILNMRECIREITYDDIRCSIAT